MFRPMRKIKNALPVEEGKALLHTARRAALAVQGDDGYPYTIPINFYYDEAESRIYFHSAQSGHKLDSIRRCDKVCLTTWNEGTREDGDWAYHVSSCVVFGRASLITDPQITEEKVRLFALKYYPSAQEVEEEIRQSIHHVQLVAVDIEHISAKRVHEK